VLPLPHVLRAESALASGVSPFDLALHWERNHDVTRLSSTVVSAWRQYERMCEIHRHASTPLSVTSLVAFMLYYVLVRRNSSANPNSVVSQIRAFADAHSIAWPSFTGPDSGDLITARIAKIQRDWPAEVRGAPALTWQAGVLRVAEFLDRKPPSDLRAAQRLALITRLHDMLLRPSDITPSDALAKARGSGPEFAHPRRGDFLFVPPVATATLGGLHYAAALSKMQKTPH
jgi:hypothetical protein